MIRIPALAKVNLFLEITGKQPDGYHTLSTVFQSISLSDTLTFEHAPDLTLECNDPSLPVDETNLVMKAARKLREELKEERGAKIILQKEIPTGAGLGGGSSDAAATIQGLQRLWRRELKPSALQKLAVSLGADVPFFLEGGTCTATGIGERLRPLTPLGKTWLVLVWPGFGVSTKEAYGRVQVPVNEPRTPRRLLTCFTEQRQWAGELFNRFEEFVFPQYPEIAKVKQEMLAMGAQGALMSGSGSSVFCVVPSATEGRKMVAAFKPRYPKTYLIATL
jgi:4-diphosphocytidyl-2-C-methyl-D-erythritol kinase